MRSPALALAWDYWRYGRWTLAQFLGFLLGFPAVIFFGMRLEGVHPGSNEIPVAVHYALLLLGALSATAASLAAVGPPRRHYRLPIGAARIVAGKFVPALVVAALMSLAMSAFLNLAFGVGWPYIGPTLFFAATAAVALACFWCGWPSLLWQTALGLHSAVLLVAWFHARHGGDFWQWKPVTHLWHDVTGGEVGVLASVVAVAYVAAVLRVSRNRHNDLPLQWANYPATLPMPRRDRPFASPATAQLWFEWRQSGWAMPALGAGLIVAVPAIIAVASPFTGDRRFDREDASAIFGVLVALLFVYPLIGSLLFGLLQGERSGRRGWELGTFRGMQPATSTQLAAAVLKSGAIALAATVLLYGAAIIVALLMLPEAYPDESPMRHGDWRPLGLIFVSTLVTSWTLRGLVASGRMTGRKWVLLVPGGAAIVFVLLMILATRYIVRPDFAYRFEELFLWVVGLACLGLTTWAYLAALRRRLISAQTAVIAYGLWVTACIVAVSTGYLEPQVNPYWGWVFGLLALPLAPLATAPLALHWNRHR